MRIKRCTPSFRGLSSASANASRVARGSSKKADTKCELFLRRALWSRGLRYRLDPAGLPGKPDFVFKRRRVAVFCDGDFWHGRDLDDRLARLAQGHNAPYWVAKIRSNTERDRVNTARLESAGWRVMRLWETDILRDPAGAAARVAALVEDDVDHRDRALGGRSKKGHA